MLMARRHERGSFRPTPTVLPAADSPAPVTSAVRFFMRKTSDRPADDLKSDRYFIVLGTAAADLWSHLLQELQQSLFERAVFLGHKSERDESLREQLAKFLHGHHARTQYA